MKQIQFSSTRAHEKNQSAGIAAGLVLNLSLLLFWMLEALNRRFIFSSLILLILIISINFSSCKKAVEENEIELIHEMGGGADNCQCVAYVKNQLQITGSTANAKDTKPNIF